MFDDCFKDSIQPNRPKRPTDARLKYVALLPSFGFFGLLSPSCRSLSLDSKRRQGLMALLFKQLKRDLNVFTGLQELLVEEQLLVGLS